MLFKLSNIDKLIVTKENSDFDAIETFIDALIAANPSYKSPIQYMLSSPRSSPRTPTNDHRSDHTMSTPRKNNNIEQPTKYIQLSPPKYRRVIKSVSRSTSKELSKIKTTTSTTSTTSVGSTSTSSLIGLASYQLSIDDTGHITLIDPTLNEYSDKVPLTLDKYDKINQFAYMSSPDTNQICIKLVLPTDTLRSVFRYQYQVNSIEEFLDADDYIAQFNNGISHITFS